MVLRRQPLDQHQQIVDGNGRPNIYFIRYMQDAFQAFASGGGDIQTLLDTLSVLAQGAVIYYDGTDWVLLTPGTAGDVLTSGGAGADPTWEAPTVANIQSLLDGISTTQGVVLYYNGTDWVALSPGTSGHFLKTNGAGANPSWASAAADIQTLLDGISTTQGAILYYNGTDWVALGPGTSGHFLKTQGAGANPVWAADNGAGATTRTLISSLSAPSSGTDFIFTGLSFSGYSRIEIEWSDFTYSADGRPGIEFYASSSALALEYAVITRASSNTTATSNDSSGTATRALLYGSADANFNTDNASGNVNSSGIIRLLNPASSLHKVAKWEGANTSGNSGRSGGFEGHCAIRSTSAIDEIRIIGSAAGTLTGGKVRIYGYSA